jgi:hypothetical protein
LTFLTKGIAVGRKFKSLKVKNSMNRFLKSNDYFVLSNFKTQENSIIFYLINASEALFSMIIYFITTYFLPMSLEENCMVNWKLVLQNVRALFGSFYCTKNAGTDVLNT